MKPISFTPIPREGIVLVPDPDYYGGAVIDADGVETPITDEMVKHACHVLEHVRFPFGNPAEWLHAYR